MLELPTIIFRHKRENLKKCSLRGLEKRSDFLFFSYPLETLPNLEHYIILTLNAPILTEKESSFGLCLIDATWRYAAQMNTQLDLDTKFLCRSLPPELRTAYPRKQTDCPNPETGLASIEAIFAAYTILKRDTQGLLENYYWAKSFFELNHSFFFNFTEQMC
ncbi:MAG: hypothetical protein P4L16_04740 [Chlamydiales bacterium]|nr:hypothetical protein [Chlamydiales bacterium]